MKEFFQKLINLYNTNAKVHSLVVAIEYAAVSTVMTAVSTGTLPTSKRALVVFVTGIGGAIVGAIKRWLATNVATQNLQLKNGG